MGIVNAWESAEFAAAVRATERKHLIVAGVTTDVCLVPPALSMQEEGFHVKVSPQASTLPLGRHAPCIDYRKLR